MPEAPILPQSPLQRQIVQMALNLAGQLEAHARQAPAGGVVDACESFLLDGGRQFLRDSLAAALQGQADDAEKKGGPARTCTCGHGCRNKGAGSRELLTALGPIRLTRTYFSCPACDLGGYPVDDRLGIDGRLTRRAEQMTTLAGVHQSFRQGTTLLEQLAGWSASHEVVRQTCYRQADELARQREAASPEVGPFREAAGRMEFQTDATEVDTLEGWKDMKIGIFAKREEGQPATIQEWHTRDLPAPTARLAFAGIAEIGTFAEQWWPWAERLGLGEGRPSVLGDGADWIWDHAEMAFPRLQGVLDVYHASEHLSDAAKAACGEGTEQAARWLNEARLALLGDGYEGLCEYAAASAGWVPNRAGLEAATGALLNYFRGHQDRLKYSLRLRRGEPIGSGMVEGAAKQMIGRRMKQTAAEWAVDNANRMALLCSLVYADSLPQYFTAA